MDIYHTIVSSVYVLLQVYIAITLVYAIFIVYDVMSKLTSEDKRKEMCHTGIQTDDDDKHR
jgi:hypothetical protein